MSKKDGLEIYELFRTGPGKTATTEVSPPPQTAVKERLTAVRPGPAPAAAKAGPGEAMISVRLNTALVGLMVGTATLFGSFALGVQYERRHRPAPVETVKAPEINTTSGLPLIAREIRREISPVAPAPGGTENRTSPPPADPKKGFTLQLMGYGSDQESIANTMLRKVKEAGGAEASIVKDKSGNFIVVAGFVEKQSGGEADAVLSKYRGMASRINKPFNLNWITATK